MTKAFRIMVQMYPQPLKTRRHLRETGPGGFSQEDIESISRIAFWAEVRAIGPTECAMEAEASPEEHSDPIAFQSNIRKFHADGELAMNAQVTLSRSANAQINGQPLLPPVHPPLLESSARHGPWTDELNENESIRWILVNADDNVNFNFECSGEFELQKHHYTQEFQILMPGTFEEGIGASLPTGTLVSEDEKANQQVSGYFGSVHLNVRTGENDGTAKIDLPDSSSIIWNLTDHNEEYPNLPSWWHDAEGGTGLYSVTLDYFSTFESRIFFLMADWTEVFDE